MVRQRLTQEERKKETRNLLINSAIDAFSKFGFQGTSVDKIAEQAGFSKGAFYAHFTSKEEIFLKILELQMRKHASSIQVEISRQESLSGLINQMENIFLAVKNESKTISMLNIEFLLYSMRDDSVLAKWRDLIKKTVRDISDTIDELLVRENNASSSLSAEEIAWTILSLENGLTIFSHIGEDFPKGLYGKALRQLLPNN
ncbi:TetR/AcrR family transcriptional regulator [Oceanobacillus piezotolerans]|uniref:TetR/AcrR family transcriptional regulator n=1 Tax=Oceanobacillus piezotolerans TaxID=2448030 RepID=A0A498D464_9BACI|nr:TetR/AcrR family transcriptional regulator [Oceanobacillus piezotolerans]RLL40118.1 TetR/AcrR family transcriptional regulator [Oceanobacillus piezotolerans]